jgi:AcrR family transcriptional regulator
MTSVRAQGDGAYHHGALREALLARAAEVIEAEGLEALTLRGLARDLGVSHGAPNRHFRNREALLAALAEQGHRSALAATLDAMNAAGDDPWRRLNAMGRGYLKWAITHRTLFRVINHPDVNRFADADLRAQIAATEALVRENVVATQQAGRHPEVDPDVLTLYTHAVPLGVAMLVNQPNFGGGLDADLSDDALDALEKAVSATIGQQAA